jgi:GAF domain-containing protein
LDPAPKDEARLPQAEREALQTHSDELTRSLTALSRLLLAEETIETTLTRVAILAAHTLNGCDAAGVSLFEEDKFVTAAASDDWVRTIDELQYTMEEGPCLSSLQERRIFQIDSIAKEKRWPRFCAAAAEAGIQSSFSFPLAVYDEDGDENVHYVLGALNCYARKEGAFRDADREIGSMFAAQAAIAMANAALYSGSLKLTEQLNEALESRARIEQAKGILMARTGCSVEEAFDMLREMSQRGNMKLSYVSAQIVRSATLGVQVLP